MRSAYFSTSPYAIPENSTSATITVNLSQAPGLPTSAQYATRNGAVSSGSDYTSASGRLNFGPFDTSKTFTVSISNDSADENDDC